MAENDVGRPPINWKETLQKLQVGFKMGFNDEMACDYAGISPASLYNYQKEHPDFLEVKASWKRNPYMKATITMFKSLDDPRYALEFLQRRDPANWALLHKLEGKLKIESIADLISQVESDNTPIPLPEGQQVIEGKTIEQPAPTQLEPTPAQDMPDPTVKPQFELPTE